MKKNILLSGCTGFIGQFLIPKLINKDWNVIVLSRQPRQKIHKMFSTEVEVINHFNDLQVTRKITACINLSGENIFEKSWIKERKQILISSRIDVTKRFCNFVSSLQDQPEVFISGSAVGYYGNQPIDVVTTEESKPGNDFAAQLCNDWEKAAQQNLPATMRTCILRIGLVLHKKNGMLKKMVPLFRLGLGCKLGSGKQMMSWIHIEDLVNTIFFILETHRINGVVNAVAPYPVSNEDFSNKLAKILHAPRILKFPESFIRFIYGERSALLLTSQNTFPEKLLLNNFEFKFPELTTALQDLFK